MEERSLSLEAAVSCRPGVELPWCQVAEGLRIQGGEVRWIQVREERPAAARALPKVEVVLEQEEELAWAGKEQLPQEEEEQAQEKVERLLEGQVCRQQAVAAPSLLLVVASCSSAMQVAMPPDHREEEAVAAGLLYFRTCPPRQTPTLDPAAYPNSSRAALSRRVLLPRPKRTSTDRSPQTFDS